MSKSISPMLFLMPEAKPFRASPRSHRSDEFAVGYSLAVCSPALPASASPAGIHLQTAGSYLSTVSFGKISKLDSKVRTRQNINVRGGPNQSIEVGQTGVSISTFPFRCSALPKRLCSGRTRGSGVTGAKNRLLKRLWKRIETLRNPSGSAPVIMFPSLPPQIALH